MVKKVLTLALGLVLSFGAMATITFPASSVQYWVGTGSNQAVVVIGWDDNPSGNNFALAWGVRWNGSATAANMLDTIATYDSRVAYAISSGFVTSIGYNDGTLVSGSSLSYWCYTINGGYAGAYGSQAMINDDLMEISSSCNFTLTTATAATDPNAGSTPVEATIAFSDIVYWVGTGSNEAVLAVNWADTALAWGYRWNGTATVADMMDGIAAADPRFSYTGTGMLNDILFNDGTVSLAVTPGNWWGSTNNGIMDMGLGQTLSDGDFEKWADPAAGVIVDSTYDNTYNYWWYTYVYPMTIHAASQPLGAGPFCGIVGTEGCTAIPANSTAIKGWATACTVELGPENISVEGSPLVSYHSAQDAIGPCTMNDNLSVVALGDGGSATVTFDLPIMNGEGPDFAVFENSFNDYFLELAFVEVSSDGVRFVRFPATSLTQTVRQVTSSVDPTFINNLAGKYKMGYGTPFDLEELRDSTGIDINNITHVRVVDVVGSINPLYATYDAFGHMVNDPWPTNSYSSGFDLDGVAVINQNTNAINEADEAEVSFWPNPTADRLNISVASASEARLMDINGSTVATLTLHAGNNTFSIASLPAGIYMLSVDGNVKKIVKL